MFWKRKQEAVNEYLPIAFVAVEQTLDQIRTAVERVGEHRVRRITDLNGLVAGYALGIATAEIAPSHEPSWEDLQTNIRLAQAVQIGFDNEKQNPRVVEQLEFESLGFILGAACGLQESVNRYHNPHYWKAAGGKFELLAWIIEAVSFQELAWDVNTRMRLYERGVRLDEGLVQSALAHLISRVRPRLATIRLGLQATTEDIRDYTKSNRRGSARGATTMDATLSH